MSARAPGDRHGKYHLPFHAEYPPNASGRDFVVGDIHGYFDQLISLLTQQAFQKDRDRLFSVGDLIDRGPKSVEVLKLSREPWFYPVRGNHEQMMLDGLCSGYLSDWFINGGEWSREFDGDTLIKLAVTIQQWPLAMTINHRSGKRIGICHAQPPVIHWSDIGTAEHDADACNEMLWSRSRIFNHDATPVSGVDWIFCGHTPLDQMTVLGNIIFIDTGVFMEWGRLTMLNIDEYIDEQAMNTP